MAVSVKNKYTLKVSYWGKLIAKFLTGQTLLQLLNALNGFFLLRWLSVEDQAQFSLVFGIQSSMIMLSDVGIGGSIIALVGDRLHDKAVVGKYISAARIFRDKLFALIVLPATAISIFLMYRQGWDWQIGVMLMALMIISVYFQGWNYYAVPFQMHRKMHHIYQPQLAGGIFRLLTNYMLYVLRNISSVSVIWLNALATVFQGVYYKVKSKTYAYSSATKYDIKESQKEMLNYLAPLVPAAIFYAFQGQIMLFLISLFGKTQNVAEIAALGRLGQLFLLLGAFNNIIISPYIAACSTTMFKKRYIQILLSSTLLATVIGGIAFIVPQPFLWMLGDKYSHLVTEVKWILLSASLNFFSGTLWVMHSARKWIFWPGTWIEIISVVLILVSFTLLNDLSKTLNVVFLSFSIAIFHALYHMIIGFVCFTKDYKF